MRSERPSLRSGWILANQKFMAFHVAALLGVLAHLIQLAWEGVIAWAFIGFFFAVELGTGLLIAFITWHTVISVHEMAHFLKAGRANALRDHDQERFDRECEQIGSGGLARARWYAQMFLSIPYGRFWGVKKTEGGYFVPLEMGGDATLAVSAAGPMADRVMSSLTLPPGILAYAAGLYFLGAIPIPAMVAVYAGRLLIALGVVSYLDVTRTDDGAYRKYKEWLAAGSTAEAPESAAERLTDYTDRRSAMLARMRSQGMYQAISPDGSRLQSAPWQLRNTIHGGEHVRHQGGNISMQEFMIVPIAVNNVEAAEICNSVQDRAMQLIQNGEGMKYIGVGIEGGIVGSFDGYEERVLEVLEQAIEEAGYEPGGLHSNVLESWADVEKLPLLGEVERDDRHFLESEAYPGGELATALSDTDQNRLIRVLKEAGHRAGVWIALDVAANSLEEAYRASVKTDAVGYYQFYLRSGTEQSIVTTDELLRIYVDWLKRYPILSIEDGFDEDDTGGWARMTRELGDQVLIVGDDLVTTNDTLIAEAIDAELVNCALIKPNQIGTISETLLAIKAAQDRNVPVIVSHRSKSGIDYMEAELGMAVDALAIKCGGARLAERIHKYQRVADSMDRVRLGERVPAVPGDARIITLRAVEGQTSAGPATTRALVVLSNGVSFEASVPVATSSGSAEAVHLVDGDPHRYHGKGVLRSVEYFNTRVAPLFVGKRLDELGDLVAVDRALLMLERQAAQATYERLEASGSLPDEIDELVLAGAFGPNLPQDKIDRILQRKANLGMNTILPASVALMRVLAAREGMSPEEYLRQLLAAGIDRPYLYGGDAPAPEA
jgi:enolase